MIKEEVKIIKSLLILFDILSVIISAQIAYLIKRGISHEEWIIETFVFYGSIVIISFLNIIIFKFLKLYDEKRQGSKIKYFINVVKGVFISFGILAIMIFIFQEKTYSRIFFGSFAIINMLLTITQKLFLMWILENYLKKKPYSRRLLIIGNYERGKYILDLMGSQVSFGHQIVGFMPIENLNTKNIDETINIEKILRESCIDEIIFAFNNSKDINVSYYINKCKKAGVVCRILPSLWNPGEKSIEIEDLQGVPFIVVKASSINEVGLLFKRSIDILFGLVGCIIFLLSYPFIALAIKIDSKGPVIYKQKRVGKNGRVFTINKYRTMKINSEAIQDNLNDNNEMKGPIFKIHNDPRITKVGKYLRKFSIDEVPQFWNVLKGEMSLVGTRPPTLNEVKKYKLEHLKRIAIKPGITGMWQVSGRNLIKDFETILELDFQYIENWSFRLEMKIIAKTIWVVMKGKGSF